MAKAPQSNPLDQPLQRSQSFNYPLRVTQYLTKQIYYFWVSRSKNPNKWVSLKKINAIKTYKLNTHIKNIPQNLALHHLCSMIRLTVIRLDESGSRTRRSIDNANVSNLLHGVIVIQELSLFHLTNSAHPVVGSSHGSSVNRMELNVSLIYWKYTDKKCNWYGMFLQDTGCRTKYSTEVSIFFLNDGFKMLHKDIYDVLFRMVMCSKQFSQDLWY